MVDIVRAQPTEAGTLHEIAVAAKGYWRYPEPLLAAWAQTPIITPGSIVEDWVCVARVDAAPVGWYRLLLGRDPAQLEDLWVQPAFIGRGIGRRLFEHAAAQTRGQGLTALELDADPNARPFYEHLGCRVIGETLSEWGRLVPHLRYDLSAAG